MLVEYTDKIAGTFKTCPCISMFSEKAAMQFKVMKLGYEGTYALLFDDPATTEFIVTTAPKLKEMFPDIDLTLLDGQ